MFGVIGIFSTWPFNHEQLVHGARLLALAITCIALLPYRVIAIGALLAFVAVRLAVGAVLYGWWLGLVLALAIGFTALALVVGRLQLKGDYSLPYEIRPYGVGEFVVDLPVFLVMLVLLHKLAT